MRENFEIKLNWGAHNIVWGPRIQICEPLNCTEMHLKSHSDTTTFSQASDRPVCCVPFPLELRLALIAPWDGRSYEPGDAYTVHFIQRSLRRKQHCFVDVRLQQETRDGGRHVADERCYR